MSAVNTLGIVDFCINKIKRILSGYNLASWNTSLKKATAVYNKSPNQNYLMGSSPNDYKTSTDMQYEKEKQAGLDILHNSEKFKDRQQKLLDKGAFRVPQDREEWQRVDQPTWSGEVYKIKEDAPFVQNLVQDITGKYHDSKTVLPVDKDSKE